MKQAEKTIGILALQGAFLEHQRKIESMEHRAFLIRNLKDAQSKNWDGLILPGGESTTMKKLLQKTGLDAWLLEQDKKGIAIFGTCAGLIVLADMGLLDVEVKRNAYGSQLDSFEDDIECQMKNEKYQPDLPESVQAGNSVLAGKMKNAVFIRAPKIIKTGVSVKVLARHKKTPVWVKQNNITAASFHPELTDKTDIYEHWLKI